MAKQRTSETWAEIRAGGEAGETAPALARRFGVGVSTIRDRKAREGWRDRDRPDPPPMPSADLDDDAPSRPPEVVVAQALGRAERAFLRGDLVEAGRYLTIARQFRRFTHDETAAERREAADHATQFDAVGSVLEDVVNAAAHRGKPMSELEILALFKPFVAGADPALARRFQGPVEPPKPPDPPDPPRLFPKADRDGFDGPEPPVAPPPPPHRTVEPSFARPPAASSEPAAPEPAPPVTPPFDQAAYDAQLAESDRRLRRCDAFNFDKRDALAARAALMARFGRAPEIKSAFARPLKGAPLLHPLCTSARSRLLTGTSPLTTPNGVCECSLTYIGEVP